MGKVGIIGVGQSRFVRAYPGSVRELAFEAFKEAILENWSELPPCFETSSVSRDGIEELLNYIGEVLEMV